MSDREKMHLPVGPPPANDGRTRAAWTTTAVVVVGAVVVAVGMIATISVLVWSGVVIIVLGLILGAVMAGMGYGQRDAPGATDHGGAASRAPSEH